MALETPNALKVGGYIDLPASLTPGNPAAGLARLYRGSDNKLHLIDSSGAESAWGGGSTGDMLLGTAQTVTGLKTFAAANASTIGMIVNGAASQSAHLQDWSVNGTIQNWVDAFGAFGGSYLQGLAATGPYLYLPDTTVQVVNRGSAAYVPFTVKGMASQSGDLQQWQTSLGAVLASIDSAGAFHTGSALIAANLQDTSGVGPYIALGSSSLMVVNRAGITNVPLIVRGMASQSGNLQSWQDSTGATVAQVIYQGSMYAAAFSPMATTGAFYNQPLSSYALLSSGSPNTLLLAANAAHVPLAIKQATSQSADLVQYLNSAGAAIGSRGNDARVRAPYIMDPTDVGPYISFTATSLTVANRGGASQVPFDVLGQASQTGDMTTWRNSGGTVLNRVTSVGNLRPSDLPTQRAEFGIDGALAPSGSLAETFSRASSPIGNLAILTSGQLSMHAIPLVAGQTITNINVMSGATGAGTPTHWWFSLHDNNRALLRQAADQTTTAWGANTVKTLAFGAGVYVVPTTGLYYIGVMVAATTVPTLYGITNNLNIVGIAPILSGNSSSASLTTTAPNPAGAITPSTNRLYAWVS